VSRFYSEGFVVGIDATNLRRGGGVTHLIELLTAAEPKEQGIAKVVVFGGRQQLAKLPERDWLEKINPPEVDCGLLRRTVWQRFGLADAAHASVCDVLFAPGGSYSADFHPAVTMSRNMLPFEWSELRRYRWSFTALRLLLLRWVQSKTFQRVDGLIFLTDYAMQGVLKVTGPLSAASRTIPHGLNSRFRIAPKAQQPIAAYSLTNPYRVLYVSIIDLYKHQWHVVEAVAALRQEGLPVSLDLVGPAYEPARARLQAALARFDPQSNWARYHGPIPFEALHQHYAGAHAGLFASSCENMPNILLETMASGLPVACSNRGPMPEILGNAGIYFDPEQPHDIARALRELLSSPQLRRELAHASYERAQQFSWQRCADETFKFLVSVVEASSRPVLVDRFPS
jgi:glycosyltransferase involved in cell wall biosynthesis